MKWKKEMEMEVVSILIWFDFISYPRNIQPIKFRNLLDKNLYFNWSYFLISFLWRRWNVWRYKTEHKCVHRTHVSVFACQVCFQFCFLLFVSGFNHNLCFSRIWLCVDLLRMRVMGDRENTENARWKLNLGLRAKVVDVRPRESQMRHLYFIPHACVLACKC